MLNRWLLYQTLELPALGAIGLLPVGRRVRVPRSAAGCAWPSLYAASRRGTRADPAGGSAPVRRRRRAALVAPAVGSGRRTRISDDLLWLPYVTTQYVQVTDDRRHSRRDGAFPRAARNSRRTSMNAISCRTSCRRVATLARALPPGNRSRIKRSDLTVCHSSAPGDWNDGHELGRGRWDR